MKYNWRELGSNPTHWTQSKSLKYGGMVIPYGYKWFNGYILCETQTNVYNALSFDVDNAVEYHGKGSNRVMDAMDVRARFLDSCFIQIAKQQEIQQ